MNRRRFLHAGAGAMLCAPPLCARLPNRAAILIYLPGGLSHIDTYDPKPDAPAEFRGEFQTIQTSVPGIRICELFPKQAAIMHRLTIIRSVTGMVEEHSDAQLMSGFSERDKQSLRWPSIGAVIAKAHGGMRAAAPPFVSLRGETIGLAPGFLRDECGPLVPKPHLELCDVMRRALHIQLEPAYVRQRYGSAVQFLIARRLVEAGVSFVTLSFGGWDTHEDNFQHLRRQLPPLDSAFAALVEDLCERGLDKEVLVVVASEFGRSPRINSRAGRDHWTGVMSCVMAGGDLDGGRVVGASSRQGEYPSEGSCTPQHILEMVGQALDVHLPVARSR